MVPVFIGYIFPNRGTKMIIKNFKDVIYNEQRVVLLVEVVGVLKLIKQLVEKLSQNLKI
jgi:hypothetical protein